MKSARLPGHYPDRHPHAWDLSDRETDKQMRLRWRD